MTGYYGVVIRTRTEEQAKKLAKKISDVTSEAGMDPRPVDIYKFEGSPDLKYYIIG